MKALLDGDVILYRSCFATEYNTYSHPAVGTLRYKKDLIQSLSTNFDDDDPTANPELITSNKVTEPITFTYQCIDSCISTILRNTGCTDYTIFLEGEGEKFRKKLDYPVVYKGNRPPKPSNYQEAKRYLSGLKNVTVVTGPYEVDDLLGIEATKNPSRTVICSVDKDLKMIPCHHYDIDKVKLTTVSELDSIKAFWKQMLMGDRVDNIIGIRGIGPVKADKIIDELDWPSEIRLGYRIADPDLASTNAQVIKSYYDKEFGDNSDKMFKANAQLLWIRRLPL